MFETKPFTTKMSLLKQTVVVGTAERESADQGKTGPVLLALCYLAVKGKAELRRHLTCLFVLISADPFSMRYLPLFHQPRA